MKIIFTMQLREQGVNLEQEDNAAGFLGVNLVCDEETGLMEMKQVGLINRLLETLGLDDGITKNKLAPYESSTPVKDADGPATCGSFNYISVVGMLLYLSGNNSPGIAYAVKVCARYMFYPKH